MRHAWAISFLFVSLSALSACQDDPFPTDDELTSIQGLYRLSKPPADASNAVGGDESAPRFAAASALGTQLFHDTGLSGCGTVACATCHVAPAYTVPTAAVQGCGGLTGRNPPTVLNAAFGDWFMWDGRKDSLWDQATGPMLSPVEMAATPDSVQAFMQAKYASDYAALFGRDPASETDAATVVANVGKVIEAYERSVIKVKAPFDDKIEHFIASAQAGTAEQDPFYLSLKTFVRTGRCVVCHKGPMLTDGQFHDLGIDEKGKTDHGRQDGITQLKADPFNSAGIYSDDANNGKVRLASLDTALATEGTDGAFKTASLRNVALTAPYFHTGSLATLDDVISFYDRGGDPVGSFNGVRTVSIVPLHLSPEEKQALKDLLTSLTGTETP
jgi:cytochrome c peroxidase